MPLEESKGDLEDLIEKLYSANRAIGNTGREFDRLAALSSRGNLRTIEQLMKQHSPRYTLEIGMAFGGSAVAFAAMHKNSNSTACQVHVAIDPFQSAVWDNVGRLKLAEAHLTNFVEVIEEKSSIVLPRLMAQGRRFGVIYIDGSHLFEDVFIDAYFSMRLLEAGGYLLFDDSTNSHVAKVIAFINASIPGLERQPEITLKQTIARFVGKRQLTVYRRIGTVDRQWDAPFDRF
jgi:cephalosporin hydroxylase